jgi:hypothetical protein
MDGVEHAMAIWSAPNSGPITPGFSEVRDRAANFAKENANAAVYCLRVRLLRKGATDVAALPRGHLLVKT